MRRYVENQMAMEAAMQRGRRKGMTRKEKIEDDLEQEWYTVAEAAEELEEHPKTIYRRIHQGEIRAVRPSPRKTRIHYTDLAAYMSKDAKRNS